MSVISDVLEAVIDLAEAENPYAPIRIGALPADNGLCMAVSSGAPDSTFMTKSFAYALDIVFNGKHTDAQTVANTLCDIHEALTQRKQYPVTDAYQITDIVTVSAPNMIEREANSQILYGSFLRVKFFYKKGEIS